MSQIGELMALFLQETEETERGKNKKSTIVDLLTSRAMDGSAGRLRRRRSLHERLGLKSMVCCGSTWGFGASAINTQTDNDDEDENDVVESVLQPIDVNPATPETISDPDCTVASPRMNLADALAAERQFRSTDGIQPLDRSNEMFVMTPAEAEEGTPLRISLMRLLEETEMETEMEIMDGQDEKEGLGRDQMCCVCMGRKKGAALIPCGHTFCRVCCRELWLNRGTCPLCNRSILEILDIY